MAGSVDRRALAVMLKHRLSWGSLETYVYRLRAVAPRCVTSIGDTPWHCAMPPGLPTQSSSRHRASAHVEQHDDKYPVDIAWLPRICSGDGRAILNPWGRFLAVCIAEIGERP